jgi:1-acyl-sn-glycerol-3-phosphate acyltransferase
MLRAALVTDPLIILATIVMGTVSLAASLFDSSGRAQHRVARAWARMLLRVAGARVRIEGLEHIEPEGRYVVASNHESFMDIPLLMARLPLQFRFMAKKSLFRVPFIGFHLKRAGHIPVLREDARAGLRASAEAAAAIRERGVSVLVFPEGGRSPAGIREFKEGAAYIAIKAGVPIVPVAISGARDLLPMGSLLVRGAGVRLSVGEPIPTVKLNLHDRGRLTAQVRERVLELAQEQPVRSAS